MSKKYEIELEISGIDPMPLFQFKSLNNEYYKIILPKNFLKKKFFIFKRYILLH